MSTENDPKKLVEQGYDQVAEKYANLERAGEWPRMRWLQKILDRLEPGSRVLDLGCGSGDPADIAVAKQHQITGVDISGAQIERARKMCPAAGSSRAILARFACRRPRSMLLFLSTRWSISPVRSLALSSPGSMIGCGRQATC